ncbi:MAG: lamin tail domain-containing protein, partial [Crocinitomicaceae bacterium]
MKKILFSVFSLLAGLSYSQDCTKIFISEYVEGWSNNKALEIYNPTSAPIDLSQYFVARYSNGSTTATVANSVQLSGTIAPYDVYVAVLDKRDPNGTGQEAPIWDSLNVRGDGFYSPVYNTSNAFYWNGNDAVMLAKGTLPADPATLINATNVPNFAIIDIFGKIGENPANETGSSAGNDGAWSTQFPYSNGLGVLVTKDHSMLRKASIKKGVTAPVSFFDPLLEWDTIPPVTYLFDANGDTIVSVNGNAILFGNWFSFVSPAFAFPPAPLSSPPPFSFSFFPPPPSSSLPFP